MVGVVAEQRRLLAEIRSASEKPEQPWEQQRHQRRAMRRNSRQQASATAKDICQRIRDETDALSSRGSQNICGGKNESKCPRASLSYSTRKRDMHLRQRRLPPSPTAYCIAMKTMDPVGTPAVPARESTSYSGDRTIQTATAGHRACGVPSSNNGLISDRGRSTNQAANCTASAWPRAASDQQKNSSTTNVSLICCAVPVSKQERLHQQTASQQQKCKDGGGAWEAGNCHSNVVAKGRLTQEVRRLQRRAVSPVGAGAAVITFSILCCIH